MKYRYETVVWPEGKCFLLSEEIGWNMNSGLHVHAEPEITWVESSFGVRYIGDSISEYRENDVVLIGSMLPHHYMSSPQDSQGPQWSRMKNIKFGDDFMRLLALNEFASIRKMFDASASGVVFPKTLANDLAPLLTQLFEADAPFQLVRLLDLLSHLAESSYTSLSTVGSVNFEPDKRMSRVLNHIHTCLEKGKKVSLSDTAKVACLTPQSFSRYFKQGTHKRFTDYVTELRIGRACGLLADGRMSILEVALAAGFQNLSNFNRHFRRIKKLTPRQYRKAFREQTQ